MTVIILAGGRSSRMGHRDKAFIKIGKIPIIKRQVRLLKAHFKKILVVTNSPDRYTKIRGVEVIPDIVAGLGPLGGIASGLLASKDRYNFVIACDMPFINPRLMKYMRSRAAGYDVVVPRIGNRYEPLFSLYSKACVRPLQKLLAGKVFKISRLFSRVKVREIGRQEISRFGRPDQLFMNINTPAELSGIHG